MWWITYYFSLSCWDRHYIHYGMASSAVKRKKPTLKLEQSQTMYLPPAKCRSSPWCCRLHEALWVFDRFWVSSNDINIYRYSQSSSTEPTCRQLCYQTGALDIASSNAVPKNFSNAACDPPLDASAAVPLSADP